MQKIINNLALLDLINFAKDKNIDITDTYLYKYPRKYIYSLRKNNKRSEDILSVQFYKNQAPVHFIN